MKTLVENLANLIKIKSLITLTMVGGITYGFVAGLIDPATFAAMVGAIITYYFTRKETKDE